MNLKLARVLQADSKLSRFFQKLARYKSRQKEEIRVLLFQRTPLKRLLFTKQLTKLRCIEKFSALIKNLASLAKTCLVGKQLSALQLFAL